MKLENDKVVDHIGTVLAEKIRGEWHTKNPEVLEFIQGQEKAPKKKAKVEETELEMVRARDENGHFIADDPNTPEVNEAWVVKTIKKVIKK